MDVLLWLVEAIHQVPSPSLLSGVIAHQPTDRGFEKMHENAPGHRLYISPKQVHISHRIRQPCALCSQNDFVRKW